MQPIRRISLAAILTGVIVGCETPDTFAPATDEVTAAPAFSQNPVQGQVFRGAPQFESFFDIYTGAWSRVMLVQTPVNPALFKGSVDSHLFLRTTLRFLTLAGQLVIELPTRTDRLVDMANFTEYGKDGFTEYGKDGVRLVAPLSIDAAWQSLVDTKSPTLIVETVVDLLMEDEGIVSVLASTAGRAVYDMTNASLIKSPRDSFSNVDPVVWVTARDNPQTGALDHLVVIAFELWTPFEEIAFALDVTGFFAVNGQRFIEQQPWSGDVVDAADYVFRPRSDNLFNPKLDAATELPIVNVERTLIVRSFLIPDSDWKQIEAAMTAGTVTVGMNLGLLQNTPSGAAAIDQVFIAGLAEPRPDPAWLLGLLN